ncbi:MAG: hypothetical protein CMH48_05750 [Muricauda sp.]|uniref:Uncharacterized protein n=1 Tax=Flagellimonas lutaonensis TaxID=516051 RepID=A0A0D5YRS8_9FLAO|nr:MULTISPECIES: DUF6427 family protein [Allomuricauda]AKA34995.1 hypothetical protein VC82_1368 [Allomuricauda lutaonensis]MBC30330.1 hypothetical protein [Allomuricauda sp.]
MISRFFGKTQPIQYVVLLVFLFAFHWLYAVRIVGEQLTPNAILGQLLLFALVAISILFADMMVKKHKITGQHSFFMLFWVLLIILFPNTVAEAKAMVSNFFVLLAVHRLLEVKSLKNLKHKIFDAMLWVCFASLFCPWTLLFFGLVFFSINTYAPKSTKTWLSALAGIATFLMLTLAVLFWYGKSQFFVEHYDFVAQFKQGMPSSVTDLNSKIIVFAALVVIMAIIDFVKFRKKGGGRIIVFRFMLLYFFLALLVNALAQTSPFYILFSFMPASVFIANYIETIKRAQLKEAVLALFILAPLALLLEQQMG